MSNLKELTWEHHKDAERQIFVKELLGGNISKDRYATFLFNQYPQYSLLETFATVHGLIDVLRGHAIYEDYRELWCHDQQPILLPVVKDYMDHLISIKDNPDKLMAHIYVRHMGDLSGGQIIAKRVPGAGRLYKFDQDVGLLKEKIKQRLDDGMAPEAKICFEFAARLFKEMMET